MRGKVVQFGAGSIGRGFMGQLFHESEMEVVFVDVSQAICAELNSRQEYVLHIIGNDARTKHITNVRAIESIDTETIADEIADAQIVCTAVGANALQHIASAIATGIRRRYQQSGEPVNIVICENLANADEVLRNAVASHLPVTHREEILARTGFVQAVVSRMVPVPTVDEREYDLLAIRAESYAHLPVDAIAIVGMLPQIVGMEAVANFGAQVERKLYLHNCAHAVLGYHGIEAGYTYGYEALHDCTISNHLREILVGNVNALAAKYNFSPAAKTEMKVYIGDLLIRFDNTELGDTCRRLARDPIRKLAPDDRIVGAARLCEQQKVPYDDLASAIGSALRYVDTNDASATKLQRMLHESGLSATLEFICGIHKEEKLFAMVSRSYHSFPRNRTLGRA